MRTRPMRKGLLFLTACLIVSFVWAGSAFAVPVTYVDLGPGDTNLNVRSNALGFRDIIDSNTTDTILFGVNELVIDYVGGMLDIDFTTQFSTDTNTLVGVISAYVADVFVNIDGTSYGVVLKSHNQWASVSGQLITYNAADELAGNVYQVASTVTAGNLYSAYGGAPFNVQYGIQYAPRPSNTPTSTNTIVALNALGGPVETGVVSHVGTAWSIDLTGSLFGLDDTSTAHSIEVLWGGFSCFNDPITGTYEIPRVAVPEPATILLMSCGLVGLAGLGRKKLCKK